MIAYSGHWQLRFLIKKKKHIEWPERCVFVKKNTIPVWHIGLNLVSCKKV